MITLEIDDKEVRAALGRLSAKVGEAGMRPALAAIGEYLTETTKQRFATSTAPDGSRWAPNARSTLERLLAKTVGGVGKKGKISAKGSATMIGKKPLVETGQLARTIRYQLIPGGVAVGTDRFADKFAAGAAVHQFGSEDGRIPARPFLGLSAGDRQFVLDKIAAHLAD